MERVQPVPDSAGFMSDDDHQSLAPALAWMTDRLAALLLQAPSARSDDRDEDDDEDERPVWGRDAASFPPDYWHWNHLRALASGDSARRADGPLPVDGPLLSIVVPVYRPALWYFRECVLSVLDQTYQRWELCLCDDGSEDPALTAAMTEFATIDPRIKSLALEANGGISAATNRALEAAGGEFIVLLDHDDLLTPDALAEIAAVVRSDDVVDVIYSDEDKIDESDRVNQPYFKPDWDPDLLLSYPYLGHVTAIRHELLTRIGGFRSEFDGSQDFDVMLRSTEVARRVVHIPKVLYHWRIVAGSAAGDPEAKPWAYAASRRALEDAVQRRGIRGEVVSGPFLGAYHVRRSIQNSPSVTVVIPYRDQAAMTVACLESLERSPGHPIDKVILVDNGSTEPETRALRRALEHRPRTLVLDMPGEFNWSAINNAAVAQCDTDMVLVLTNDIEAVSEDWLHAMVEQAQRPEVGAVGARLVYPDGKVQHAGVVLGVGGIGMHLFSGLDGQSIGYFGWDRIVRSYSALSAACLLVRRDVFDQVGGFDESLPVAFNDLDFCLRLGCAGYRLLYTPHAGLIHYESASRGLSGYAKDFRTFVGRWWDVLRADDPYYNPNLSRVVSWCAFRWPGENEEWLASVAAMVPADVPLSAP